MAGNLYHYSDSEEGEGEGSAEEGSDIEEEPEDMDDGSEDEDEDTADARPYMALIKSLTEDTEAPSAKRRKLDHQSAPSETPKDEPVEPEETAADPDFVEETEEAPDEAEVEGVFDEGEDAEDDEIDTSDPFDRHFVAIDEASLARRLKAIADANWTTKKVAAKGTRTVLNGPDTGDDSDQISVPAPVSSASELSLKHKLQETMAGKKSKFDAVGQSLAPYIFGYNDLLYCNRTTANGESLRQLACLHALNHVFKYAPSPPCPTCDTVLTTSQDPRPSYQK